MGIPSYFAYIIRNHKHIVKPFQSGNGKVVQHVLMDSNSIIYDEYYAMIALNEHLTEEIFENELIQRVITKISRYILLFNPTESVYIAFDGVAPFAKMDQQRTRRFKAWFLEEQQITKRNSIFNSVSITSGTPFMRKLSTVIEQFFCKAEKESKYRVIVSGSNHPGEGEHKMFAYLREPAQQGKNILVYGLDADLIMLSLFHLQYCKNMVIVRESPEFGGGGGDKGELSSLHVPSLANSIGMEMKIPFPCEARIHDYIFLCFFLGNDFLPGFPSANLRTIGLEVLLDFYRTEIGNHPDRFFIANGTIQWEHVERFVNALANHERGLLENEIQSRNKKFGNGTIPYTKNTKEEWIMNSPVMFRASETYICPSENGWEDRYYKALFETHQQNPYQIAHEYLKGLQWVFMYYTSHCIDWKWKYGFHYTPLFRDIGLVLKNGTPKWGTESAQPPCAFSMNSQLLYVLPSSLHRKYLDTSIVDYMHSTYPEYFNSNHKMEFKWAFKRYLWESHIVVPDIPISILDSI